LQLLRKSANSSEAKGCPVTSQNLWVPMNAEYLFQGTDHVFCSCPVQITHLEPGAVVVYKHTQMVTMGYLL